MAMLTPGGDAVCRTTDIMSDAAYGKQAKNPNSWNELIWNFLRSKYLRYIMSRHRFLWQFHNRRRISSRKIRNRRLFELQMWPFSGRWRPHERFFPARKIRLALLHWLIKDCFILVNKSSTKQYFERLELLMQSHASIDQLLTKVIC